MEPVQSERSSPRVSVVVITYQHAAYIERCVKGVLMQRTDFDVELLIGEDESNDGTREICERLAKEHPNTIRLFLRSRKDQIQLMGGASGRHNFLRTLADSRGELIALCEGDDYWIDPLKLQRQVDALDRDPEASACFTNAYNIKGGMEEVYLGEYTRVPEFAILREADYLKGQGIPTCTLLFRRELIRDYEKVIKDFATGDSALFTLLLGKGHFIYQSQLTAKREVHAGGMYSMKGAVHHLKVQLQNLPQMDRLSGHRHSAILKKRRENELAGAWHRGIRAKNWELARIAWAHLRKEREIVGWGFGKTWLNGFFVHYPRAYEWLISFKQALLGTQRKRGVGE